MVSRKASPFNPHRSLQPRSSFQRSYNITTYCSLLPNEWASSSSSESLLFHRPAELRPYCDLLLLHQKVSQVFFSFYPSPLHSAYPFSSGRPRSLRSLSFSCLPFATFLPLLLTTQLHSAFLHNSKSSIGELSQSTHLAPSPITHAVVVPSVDAISILSHLDTNSLITSHPQLEWQVFDGRSAALYHLGILSNRQILSAKTAWPATTSAKI